jgi:hypothetical protein
VEVAEFVQRFTKAHHDIFLLGQRSQRKIGRSTTTDRTPERFAVLPYQMTIRGATRSSRSRCGSAASSPKKAPRYLPRPAHSSDSATVKMNRALQRYSD